jgi:hemoglobin
MRNLVKTFALSLMALSLTLMLALSAAAQGNPSLYQRLGGKKAIEMVVDEFINNCATDPRISAFFKQTAADKQRLTKFRNNLVNQICEAAKGPCKYTGKSMKESHKGMGVKDQHFNALVEDLVKALDKFKVPEKEKNELLGALGPMKKDIVE